MKGTLWEEIRWEKGDKRKSDEDDERRWVEMRWEEGDKRKVMKGGEKRWAISEGLRIAEANGLRNTGNKNNDIQRHDKSGLAERKKKEKKRIHHLMTQLDNKIR